MLGGVVKSAINHREENELEPTVKAWPHEGQVVAAICQNLRQASWTLGKVADTATKARGIDITAEKGGRQIVIEAKGFPSAKYEDPRRRDEVKRTHPSNQAIVWYASAVLKAMQMQQDYPDAIVAVGLPKADRYAKLQQSTEAALRKLGIYVATVSESGEVTWWPNSLD